MGINIIFRHFIITLAFTCICFKGYCQYVDKRKAIGELQQQLKIAKSDTERVSILIKIANSIECKDSIQKLKYLKQAIDLSKKHNWLKGLFDSYLEIGDCYQYCIQNNTLALDAYLNLEKIAIQKNDTGLLMYAYNIIGLFQHEIGQNRIAIDYFNKIVRLNVNDDITIGTWANIGVVYYSLGNFPKALESYETSLQLLNKLMLSEKQTNIQHQNNQTGLLFTTADLYMSTGDVSKALKNYDVILHNAMQLKDNTLICFAYEGIGHCHLLKKDIQNAIQYYKKALNTIRLCKKDDVAGFEEKILEAMARCYLQMGQVDEAERFAMQSLTISEKTGNNPQLIKTYTTLGNIYNAKKKYPLAIQYLEKAITLAKTTGALDDEKLAYEALSNTYSGMHQPEKAFEAYKQFIALRDTIYNADKAKELTRMDMQGEFDRKQTADSIREADEKKIAAFKLQRQRIMSYSGFAAVIIAIIVALLIYRNYSNSRKANRIITLANETIKEEKQVSENLLLNILPAHVADELKRKGDVDAKQFDDVTILFTDFVNFTITSEKLTPAELVAELHTCFKAFDEITGKYKIEKIKTVGDAYLAAAGLPDPNSNHAADIVNAALEIRDFMKRRKELFGDRTFGIRLGVNSGTVVAGIVGVKKFAYDIWGDAVNTAARMEQNSEHFKINISQSTYDIVKDRFDCTYRGELEAKNKGKLKMYFVEPKSA